MIERAHGDDRGSPARGAARYPADEVEEVADFLAWLQRGDFVLLGAREYDFTDGGHPARPRLGAGHPRRRGASPRSRSRALPLRRAARLRAPSALERRPAAGRQDQRDRARAPARADGLHRRPPRRARRRDRRRCRALLGLFTTKAYAEPASETPLLHRKLRQCLDAEDLIEGSHDYKAAVALFDSFPKDELFAAPVDDLRGALAVAAGARGHRPRSGCSAAATPTGAARR